MLERVVGAAPDGGALSLHGSHALGFRCRCAGDAIICATSKNHNVHRRPTCAVYWNLNGFQKDIQYLKNWLDEGKITNHFFIVTHNQDRCVIFHSQGFPKMVRPCGFWPNTFFFEAPGKAPG